MSRRIGICGGIGPVVLALLLVSLMLSAVTPLSRISPCRFETRLNGVCLASIHIARGLEDESFDQRGQPDTSIEYVEDYISIDECRYTLKITVLNPSDADRKRKFIREYPDLYESSIAAMISPFADETSYEGLKIVYEGLEDEGGPLNVTATFTAESRFMELDEGRYLYTGRPPPLIEDSEATFKIILPPGFILAEADPFPFIGEEEGRQMLIWNRLNLIPALLKNPDEPTLYIEIRRTEVRTEVKTTITEEPATTGTTTMVGVIERPATSDLIIGYGILLTPIILIALSAWLLIRRRRRKRAEKPMEPPTRYCMECGAPIPVDAAFCEKCGRRVETLGGGD